MLDTIFDYISSDPVLTFMPILITINLILGVVTSIKKREFQLKKLANFMCNGLMIVGFLIVMNLLYHATLTNDFGDVAVYGIQGLRAAAWVGSAGYYLSSILSNLYALGMPKIHLFDKKLSEINEAPEETTEDTDEGENH